MPFAYKDFLKREYPSAYNFIKGDSSERILFFPEAVPLSSQAFKKMSEVVKRLFKLKKKNSYQDILCAPSPFAYLKNRRQDSALMAYDFHIQGSEPKLIEVNTNASGFLMVNSFYQFQKKPYKEAKKDLQKSFQAEWRKFQGGAAAKAPRLTALIDDSPFKQKMAAEFFMYKDFFKSMGWPFRIYDASSLYADEKGGLYTPEEERVDFIYNRTTDFYFAEHPHLAQSYEQGGCAFSPHPREYYLLSDKRRLRDWSRAKQSEPDLKKIEKQLLFSDVLDEANKEKIWPLRKKYFFKSLQGYGGKLAYRGASLTRKKFDEMAKLTSLVQEFAPPSVFKDSKGQEWKTDFRAYVYEDQIQQIAARCYKGQLTGFQEEGSGFAVVDLV